MKITTLPIALLLALSPSLMQAQVSIHINLGLPIAPPLVEVEPGIQVVEGFREEVFFNDGWYWCRRPDGWYRAHSPRERFDRIDAYRVPRILMREPLGHYRNWHHDGGHGRFDERPVRGQWGHRGSHGWDERQAPRRDDHGHGQANGHQGRGRRPLLPPQYP